MILANGGLTSLLTSVCKQINTDVCDRVLVRIKILYFHIFQVSKIVIGHDGKGLGAGWYLDSVILDVPSQGQQMKFACNRWFAEDEDDGLIERELYPSEENELTTSKDLHVSR